MSLIEQLATERRARLMRLGSVPVVKSQTPVREQESCVIVKPQFPGFNVQQNYYHQMWFYELVTDPRYAFAGTVKLAVIQTALCNHFEVRKVDLLSQRRHADIARVRHIGYYLSRRHTALSLPEIGRRFGNRDHTTILHGVKKIEGLLSSDQKLITDIGAITRKLGVIA